MDAQSIEPWIAKYIEAFTACGRGMASVDTLFEFYGVPLLFTSDNGLMALATREEVTAVIQSMIEGMRAADYDHSVALSVPKVSVVNDISALYEASFARFSSDGSEINRLGVTYVVTDGEIGRRISAVLMHS